MWPSPPITVVAQFKVVFWGRDVAQLIECLPSMHEAHKLGLVHTCDSKSYVIEI